MDANYNTAHSASYEGVSPARVLSGITSFYDEGIKPNGNVNYSVSREEAKLKDGVRTILDEYNNEGIQYRSEIDIANGIEALINDYEGDATELENILNDFRMAQDDARAWGNRMDSGGEEAFMDALNAWVNKEGNVSESYSLSYDRLTKRTVEKGFGGIWIADQQEFAKFASAVRTTPHEEDGEGIAFTDNYFYAYYRNIDGLPIPYASVYMNRYESQDVVDEVNKVIANVRKGERAKFYFDRAVVRFRTIQHKDNANNGDNQSASHSVRTPRMVRGLLRKGRYYVNPHLYVKTQRTNRLDYEDIVRGEYYSRDQHYLNAVDNGDLETAQKDVIEAAEDAGYTEKVYHGTNAFGFTTFKSHRPSGAIFTTTRREVSANYAGDSYYASIRRINKGYKTPESVEDVINNARSVFNQDWRLATQEDKDIEIAKVEAEAEKILGKLGDLRVEMPEDIETAIAEIESIIYDGAYARDNEISKQTIERDYELFREARAILRDYNADNLTDKQKDYRNFLLSYEYGDAAIDVGEGLAKAVDSGDYAIVEDHSLMPIERLAEITKETHNIGSYELMGNLGNNPLVIDAKGRAWYDLNYEGLRNTDDIAEWAKENGYTSVVFEDIYDYGDRSEVKVFFNSKQLKSADPVTYDDKGNIIPLSERFNTKKDDIRYSLNRDDVTIATPEMEAEANPSTPNTMTEQEVVAENEAKKIINKKDISIEEIKSKSLLFLI